MNIKRIVRAAVYARYSSDNQREESIDAQVRAIEEFARKNGYELVKPYYIDRAKSATSDRRPEFQQMIKDAERGQFECVIVHKLDRFSRDRYDSAIYKNRLKKCNTHLRSVIENLDGSPESVIMESVIEGMAHYYSANLSREVSKGMKETALQCRHTGGKPPLGYDIDFTKKYIINEREAKIVQFIFEKYLEGYGYNVILDMLEERCYKTKTGGKFSKRGLYDILRNEKYTGVYIFNQVTGRGKFANEAIARIDGDPVIRIEGGMPIIISKEDFEKTQVLLKENKRMAGSNKAKRQYLLTGIIYCGCCGASMQGNSRMCGRNKSLYETYRCSCRANKRQCSNKEIRKQYLEEYVLENLEQIVLNEGIIPSLTKELNQCVTKQLKSNKEDLEVFTDRIKLIDKEITKFVQAITVGVDPMIIKDQLDKLSNDKEQLKERIRKLEQVQSSITVNEISEEDIKKVIENVSEFVRTRNVPECKKFIRDYVKRIEVHEDHVEVTFNMAFSLSEHITRDQSVSESKADIILKYRRYFDNLAEEVCR